MSEESSSPAERARAFLESVDDPGGLVDDLIDDAQFEAAQRVDPSLARTAELRLRLAGPQIADGFYDPAVEDALAGPLGRELAAASDSNLPQTRLGLVGVSAGSVILHYRPRTLHLEDADDQAGLPIVPADAAVRRVLRLHDLFESGAPAAEIASLADNNHQLLRGARGVVEALVAFELDLSATWWSPSGQRVLSSLTKVGRDHASKIFRREEQPRPENLWGLVSALDVEGVVTLRRNSQKYRIRVSKDQVLDFSLGERVHLQAMGTARVDRVGLKGRVEYTFMRMLELDETLDFGERG